MCGLTRSVLGLPSKVYRDSTIIILACSKPAESSLFWLTIGTLHPIAWHSGAVIKLAVRLGRWLYLAVL